MKTDVDATSGDTVEPHALKRPYKAVAVRRPNVRITRGPEHLQTQRRWAALIIRDVYRAYKHELEHEWGQSKKLAAREARRKALALVRR
jgi:hypothetical protein